MRIVRFAATLTLALIFSIYWLHAKEEAAPKQLVPVSQFSASDLAEVDPGKSVWTPCLSRGGKIHSISMDFYKPGTYP